MRKRRGHFCWCCGRMKPNERFSGRGHAHHLCKDCQKLGRDELAYRQAVRNIDHMCIWETGRIRRNQLTSFARFLTHPNERIRQYAERVARESQRGTREDDGLCDELALTSEDAPGDAGEDLVWEEDEGRSP